MENHSDTDAIIRTTRCWIERVVVALNLCPFARKPIDNGQVRYVVSIAHEPAQLREDLQRELALLRNTEADKIQTTVLIHPYVLNDFLDYNDFLGVVDDCIEDEGYEGEFQVASFHPDYQFSETQADDAENYTNRSPYPMLHLLREAGLAQAIAGYARPDKIPERNIRTLEKMGAAQMKAILESCMKDNEANK